MAEKTVSIQKLRAFIYSNNNQLKGSRSNIIYNMNKIKYSVWKQSQKTNDKMDILCKS